MLQIVLPTILGMLVLNLIVLRFTRTHPYRADIIVAMRWLTLALVFASFGLANASTVSTPMDVAVQAVYATIAIAAGVAALPAAGRLFVAAVKRYNRP